MSIYFIGDVKWWTNANDMSNSGEWIWSLGGGNFSVGSTEVYNNWRAGKVYLSTFSHL